MERLPLTGTHGFSAVEAAIHLNRYLTARSVCRGKTVLDVACGEGYGAYLMAECWGAGEVHGVDVSPDAVARARDLLVSPRVTYHCGAAEDLEAMFRPARFDLVV